MRVILKSIIFILFALYFNAGFAFNDFYSPTPNQKSPNPYSQWIESITPNASINIVNISTPWGVDLLAGQLAEDKLTEVEFYLETIEIAQPIFDKHVATSSMTTPKSTMNSTEPTLAKVVAKDVENFVTFITRHETITWFLSGAFVMLFGIIIGMLMTKMSMRKSYRRW